jgi:hypothetical protein
MTDEVPAEIQRLFAELREAYARVNLAVPSAESFSDAAAHHKFVGESHRASAIIQRIRELQGL